MHAKKYGGKSGFRHPSPREKNVGPSIGNGIGRGRNEKKELTSKRLQEVHRKKGQRGIRHHKVLRKERKGNRNDHCIQQSGGGGGRVIT